jgi:hypothetical protein
MKIHDFMDKTNFFFGTLSINPWTVFAVWLHLGAPQENTKKINKNNHFKIQTLKYT